MVFKRRRALTKHGRVETRERKDGSRAGGAFACFHNLTGAVPGKAVFFKSGGDLA
jgi:hypothetical protein